MKIFSIFITTYLMTCVLVITPMTEYFLHYFPNQMSTIISKKKSSTALHQNIPSSLISQSLTTQSCLLNDSHDITKKISPIITFNTDIDSNIADLEFQYFLFSTKEKEKTIQMKINYWTILYSIESKQGKLLFRPHNKHKSCSNTASPCGHHQLTLQALRDISCNTHQCKKDRENYSKSLTMSKQLQSLNDKRIKKAGLSNLPDYQKYLIHQQGVSGFKAIYTASKDNKELSKRIIKNMSANSPYSYKSLKNMGHKLAAKNFLMHWEKKWMDEKLLVITTNNLRMNKPNPIHSEKPSSYTFNNYELQIALNIKI